MTVTAFTSFSSGFIRLILVIKLANTAFQGTGHSTSSPSSLYAQKRKPPLTLRPDANRSTPSLLSQSSPQRRSTSPRSRQGSGTPGKDWSRRDWQVSGNTSPARSTFSVASTVNLCASIAAPSTATTPGKLPSSSPLYYDYTEDFYVDESKQPEALDPPPLFQIEKAIPEDRPTNAEHILGTEVGDTVNPRHVSPASSSSLSFTRRTVQDPDHSIRDTNKRHTDGTEMCRHGTPDANASLTKAVDTARDETGVRSVGLGYGARELSTHVEEAFGLLSSASFEILLPSDDDRRINVERVVDHTLLNQATDDVEPPSSSSSFCNLITQLPKYPVPPKAQGAQRKEITFSEPATAEGHEDPHESRETNKLSRLSTRGSEEMHARDGTFGLDSDSAPKSWIRSSGFSSIDTGLTESSNLIRDLEDANNSRSPGSGKFEPVPQGRTPMISPTLPKESLLPYVASERVSSLPSSVFNRPAVARKQSSQRLQPRLQNQHHIRGDKLESSTIIDYEPNDVPNFSHQFPRKGMPRSDSPMLAPKPISPARQLKLKNSIPQLMKALPPLPQEPIVQAVSPPDNPRRSPDLELPCCFSPILTEFKHTPVQESSDEALREPSTLVKQSLELQEPKSVVMTARVQNSHLPEPEETFPKDFIDRNTTAPPIQPPRLKLKLRTSAALRPLSPPDSRPWNLEESYPWSSQTWNVHLPSMIREPKPTSPDPPKFRLRVIRASNSTQGTVRVHREAGDSKSLAVLHLRTPKDLFTTASTVDNIFRQASKHLHSRKPSITRNLAIQSDSATGSSYAQTQTYSNNRQISDLNVQHLQSLSAPPPSPNEAQSVFSDDSSHIEGPRSLRKRLSNLRARIPVPYASKAGTHSCDDIIWKERNGLEAPKPPAAKRSSPTLGASRTSTEAKPTRRFLEGLHRQRLKAKVQGWIKGARSAITSRVKQRHSTGRGDDKVHLTTVD